ncbi:MAG: inositol monophosphatase [Pseudomonadota bacterium]|jgi:fructose-1,6-bisphosphatase/inositol monophosphatase family enzyme|nr:MAG: inositol monophosphatase [Pseudomonadota bacterium]
MSALPNPKDVMAVIRSVADNEVMPRFRNLAEGDISEKGPGDFVTVADEASEKAFTYSLPKLLSGSLVVGEEAVAKDRSVLETFKEDNPVWVIDPIDGTYNYKSGRSHFGILISLVQNGETQMGFLYDAPKNECFYAIKGQGAFQESGEKLAFPSKSQAGKTAASDMVIFAGGAQPWHFKKLNDYVRGIINIRCSLHDTLHFLRGEGDCVLWHKTTPWDQAGCTLISEEIGGYVCYLDGQPYSPVDAPQDKFLLVAASRDQWQLVADAIKDSGLEPPK